MVDASLILLIVGVTISLILSKNQINLFVAKFKKSGLQGIVNDSKSETSKAKGRAAYGAPGNNDDEPIPKPTPLMITPEQVATYDDRPWRPFRWPYHQTMSIFKLDINHWLDMDKYYVHYIEEKKRIWKKYGKENIDWLPEGEDASFELMDTVTEHLIERYPLLFTVLKDGGPLDFDNQVPGTGKIIRNELTKEILDMTLPLKQHPLLYVTQMAKEDFYLVKKRPDGLHYLVAAAVPFPGGSFGVDRKIGRNLDVIHEEVPYYKEKLQKSMERWFERMRPCDPVERASWYISWDHKLRVNNVFQLPEFNPNMDTDIKSTDPRDFNVRVERQTLRRLPKSKAIIFTNHPVFYSIDEMKDEPLIPSLIRKIIFEGPRDIIKYKNFESFRDHIVSYLDGLIKRQIDLGLIKEDTPLKTLPSYPFAHWVKTEFDYTNGGFNNPNFDKAKSNYLEKAKKEVQFAND
ncbi:uncharacterized protein RJT21DRAFT_132177 [Scheffersomyces amazonensis]|uniref:uncharacterized protein n=1 Tax=Scheffersomyces amazonensis TaxID=1078765 RepID=UPI00315D1087